MLLPVDLSTFTLPYVGMFQTLMKNGGCGGIGAGVVPRAPYVQTWLMNLSTIIMPCNYTGLTDPASTKGWGIVDFGLSRNVILASSPMR